MSRSTPHRSKSGAPRRAWRPNIRALIIVACVLVFGGVAIAVVQFARSSSSTPALLKQARERIEAGRGDTALTYLNEVLRLDPRNVEALDLKAELLGGSARGASDLLEAIKLNDQALRLAPDGPRAPEIRKRQVELILMVGPYLPQDQRQYAAGEKLAARLAADAKDAASLRLHARTLLALGLSGDEKALDRAVEQFKAALQADPTDFVSAEHLAVLYRDKKDAPDQGLKVLNDLLAKAPDSAEPHLALHSYLAELGRRADENGRRDEARDRYAQADAEIDKAVALKPDSAPIRLLAANYCLGRGRPEAARKHLDSLTEDARKDPRVRALLGLCSLQQNRREEAIETWRSGLILSHGSDAELTWQLALIYLKMGRVQDAKPLMDQFHRLTGSADPQASYQLLEGIAQLKQERPREAIATLEKAGRDIPKPLAAELYFNLGQAYEAVRDEASALRSYDQAVEAGPKLTAPRLARARILQARNPAEAEAGLRRDLQAIGDEPGLLVALARLELRKQALQPAARRDWTELRSLIERAGKLAPAAPGLAQLQAELLAAQGKGAEVADILEQATKHQPNDVELWLTRAERLTRAGDLEQAELVLDQAMAPGAAGDQAALRIAKAKLLTLRGRGQEAREALTKNLDRLPDDQRSAIWSALGDLYAAQRNPQEARAAYRQWAESRPEDPLPRLFLLEQALAEGDEKGADKLVEELRALSGEKGIFWRMARVQELFRSRPGDDAQARDARLAEAASLIDQIDTEAPEQRYAPMLRGQLLELKGDQAGAVAAYEAALRRDGGQVAVQRLVRLYVALERREDLERLRAEYGAVIPSADRVLAEEALRKGDKARAEQLGARVLEAEPENADIRLWHARLLNTVGKPDAAEATLRDFVGKHPDQLSPRLTLLAFVANRGQPAKAAEVVDQIIKNVKGLERPELTYAQCWRLAGDRDKADAAYREALKKWPDVPEVARAAADYFEATGRAPEAEQIVRDVWGRDPSQRWAARALALLRSARPGDLAAWREAWSLVGDGAASQADAPEERLARGIVLARGPGAEHHKQAKEILSKLVLDLPADYPSAGVARNVLIQLYLRDNQAAEAAEVAAVDALAPNATAASISRYAELLLAAKKPEEAGRQADRLAVVASKDLGPALLRAQILKAQGKADDAAALLRQAFAEREKDPDAKVAGRQILTAMLDVDVSAAERLARHMAETWPETTWLLASVLSRQGKAVESLDLFRDAAAKAEPADLRELAANALAAATKDARKDDPRLNQVEAVLDAVLARSPDQADLLTLKGYLRHFQERYADEVKLYEDALKKNPGDLTFLNNLAWTLCEGLDRPQEAMQWVERAFSQSKRVFPQFYDTRGVIYTRLGQIDKAVTDLEIAARGRPLPTVLAHLARAYKLAGKEEQFRKARDQAKAAGLTLEQLEPRDREELGPMLFGDDQTAKSP